MKKLLCIALSFLIILISLFPAAFAAGTGELQIVYPVGTNVSVLDKIEIADTSGKTPEKYIYELDGIKLGETEGIPNIVISDSTIAAGNHKIDVSAIYNDGTAQKTSAIINLRKFVNIKSVSQDFNSFVVTDDSTNASTLKLKIYDQGKSKVTSVVRSSGEIDDKAFCITFTTTSNILTPQIKLKQELTQYSQPNGDEYKIT